MIATTPSRVRMRALTGLGRRLHARGGDAATCTPSASRPGLGDVVEASI